MVFEDKRTFDNDVVDDDETFESNVRITGTGAVETVHDGIDTSACHNTRFATEVEDGGDAILRRRRTGSSSGGSYDGFVDFRQGTFA